MPGQKRGDVMWAWIGEWLAIATVTMVFGLCVYKILKALKEM